MSVASAMPSDIRNNGRSLATWNWSTENSAASIMPNGSAPSISSGLPLRYGGRWPALRQCGSAVRTNAEREAGGRCVTEDATLPQEQQLIRQLLMERFGLQFHKEKREMPAYALQVVKDQLKLAVAADPAAQPLE